MSELDQVIFYLMISAIYAGPAVVTTLTLIFGKPFPAISHLLGHHRAPANRGVRNIGMARFEQFFEIFNVNFMDYLTKFYKLACGVQFLTIALIILAIIYDLPLPYKPNLKEVLSSGTMYKLFVFWITSILLQFLPVVLLLLALHYNIPIPFMPKRPENRVGPCYEIIRWEQQSHDYASVRLTRFENLEKTLIYVHFRDSRLETVLKAVLYQRKRKDAKTLCFLYTDHDPTMLRVIPAPISVRQLDEVFSTKDE